MIKSLVHKTHESVAFNDQEKNYDIDETSRNLITD